VIEGERFRVEVRALKSGIPAAVRLRRWLKYGLRACELKAETAEQLKTTEAPTAPDRASESPG
jgi:hypothetical protein